MKKKTGAQEHTIIIGTILASILVFVLGFFLGRVWVLMPQEKMFKAQKKPTPTIVETEAEKKEFEDTLALLKNQKLQEEKAREQEAKEKAKRIMEEEEKKKREIQLALLKEEQEKERKKELEKIREKEVKKEKELAREKEELAKKREEEVKKEKELAKRKEEEQKRKLQKLQEEQKRKQEEIQKAMEAKRKALAEEKPKPVEGKYTPPSPGAKDEHYTLQLQASPNRERVEELLAELRARGYSAYAVQADLKEKGIWYRIRLGKYNTQEEAIEDGERLKSKGIISNYWITKW